MVVENRVGRDFDQTEPRLLGAKISYIDTTPRAYHDVVNFPEFCNGCDNLVENRECRFHPGYNYRFSGPAHFVERGFCYWAMVNNKPGRMTSKGFVDGECLVM